MRLSNMETYAPEHRKSNSQWYFMAIVGGIVLGIILMVAWNLLGLLWGVIKHYWYVAIFVILILLWLRKRRSKKQ